MAGLQKAWAGVASPAPTFPAQPDRADEVLYKLRAIILSVRSDGLIRANEEMTTWLRGERSMPFGHNNQHVPVRLIDFDDLDQNQYVATQQFTYRAGSAERRADLMLLVNGLPLVLIEAKTPTCSAVSWVDGAVQVHDDYEKFVPELFGNVFSVATEGKAYHYGSLGLPIKDWGSWNLDEENDAARPSAENLTTGRRKYAAVACGAGHSRQRHLVRYQ